jgi:calcium-dependent protein kinase
LPFGIRFERGPNNDAAEFYHNSPVVIQQLISILSKKINQRNFHKLFKAKKKIGKGAFATVYLAERLVDNKMVAVKAFSKEKQFSGDKGK